MWVIPIWKVYLYSPSILTIAKAYLQLFGLRPSSKYDTVRREDFSSEVLLLDVLLRCFLYVCQVLNDALTKSCNSCRECRTRKGFTPKIMHKQVRVLV